MPPSTTLTVSNALQRAVASYHTGRFDQAEGLCRAILLKGDHFDALHLLAIVQSRLGRLPEALTSYHRALAIKPDRAEVLYNRGNALRDLKRFEAALASYDRALSVKPDYADALINRGNILQHLKRHEDALASYEEALAITPDDPEALINRGITLQHLKRSEDALASYDKALASKLDHAETLNKRGIALSDLRRFEEALVSYEKMLAIKPDHADALINRGIALRQLKRFAEALASCDKALAIKPDCAEALNSRGNALRDVKRFDEALASYDQALAIKPDYAEALNNCAIALRHLNRFDEALASYDQALAIKPDYAEAFNNRAIALRHLKRLAEALASCDRALAINPEYAEPLINRATTLRDSLRFAAALASCDQALAIKPDHAEALINRGLTLQQLKRFAEALAGYDRALAIEPDHRYALGGMAYPALQICDWARAAELVTQLRARVAEQKSIIPPLTFLGYGSDASLQLECARSFIEDRIPALRRPLWSGTVYRHDRVRIGYLSADFRRHPVASLIVELVEIHDRTRFEVLGVSFGVDDKSDIRARLVKSFDQFHDVRLIPDREVGKLLCELEVDIAVDLMGYTEHARTEIFAHRPVPIQINYLGYPGTMGADFIDYVIADPIVLPFDHQAFYTEKIIQLPDCYQVNDSRRRIAERTPTRRAAGLPEQGFVFCCFNNSYKITAPVFDVWMRLLRAVNGSVLWLLADNASAQMNLRKEAEARGINPARLVFALRLPPEDHLARHRLADLFLDTLPYNAHTTASDALWAGLPVVTCRGATFAGRVGASLLNAIGLPELVTTSLDEYEALVLQLATDASLLQSIRAKLEQNRLRCPLFDTQRFCRHIEAAYLIAWKIWQRGESPRGFRVEAA